MSSSIYSTLAFECCKLTKSRWKLIQYLMYNSFICNMNFMFFQSSNTLNFLDINRIPPALVYLCYIKFVISTFQILSTFPFFFSFCFAFPLSQVVSYIVSYKDHLISIKSYLFVLSFFLNFKITDAEQYVAGSTGFDSRRAVIRSIWAYHKFYNSLPLLEIIRCQRVCPDSSWQR